MSGTSQLRISNSPGNHTTFSATSNAVNFNFKSVAFTTTDSTTSQFNVNVNGGTVFKVEPNTNGIVDMTGNKLKVQNGTINSASKEAINGSQLWTSSGDASAARTTLAGEASSARTTLAGEASSARTTLAGEASSARTTLAGEASSARTTLAGEASSARTNLAGGASIARTNLAGGSSIARTNLAGAASIARTNLAGAASIARTNLAGRASIARESMLTLKDDYAGGQTPGSFANQVYLNAQKTSYPGETVYTATGVNLTVSAKNFTLVTALTAMVSAEFSADVQAGSFTASSDRRLKENIEEMDVDKVLADVANIQSYTYNFKKNPEDPRWGFIAQEVKEGPLAHLVNGEETEDSYLGINYTDMIAVIPALVQKVLALEKKVSEM